MPARRADVRGRVVRAGSPHGNRRPVSSGPAVRSSGGGLAAATQCCLQPAVPGDVQRAALGIPAEPHPGRHDRRVPGQRCPCDQVRPQPGSHRPRSSTGLLPDLQHRSVRRTAHRPHGRALAQPAGGADCRSATTLERTAAAGIRRATASARQPRRRAGRTSAGSVHPSPVRRASPGAPGRAGPDLRRADPELRRTR
ncbi:hypothetical protein D3C84_479860 [compost metagenome]